MRNRFQAAAFLVVICLPIWGLLLPNQAVTTTENRSLTARPQWRGADTAGVFFVKCGDYLSDRFAFRDALIHAYGYLQVNYLGISWSDRVVVGKERFLFLRNTASIKDLRRPPVITEDQLAKWTEPWLYSHKKLKEKGIAYLIIIVPDKQEVYPQYLPDWLGPLQRPTRLDRMVKYMQENTDLPIIDARAVLEQLPDSELLYDQTDSHWTDYAALQVSVAIRNRLIALYPQLADSLGQLPDGGVEIKDELQKGGDLARMLGVSRSYTELVREYYYAEAHQKAGIEFEHFKVPTETKIWRQPAEHLCTAVLFHDSFSENLFPLLSLFFEQMVAHRLSEPRRLSDEDLSDSPDIVMQEICQRNMW